MCPFCSPVVPAFNPEEFDTRPFTTFKLNDEEFATYRQDLDKASPHQSPDMYLKHAKGPGKQKLKVVGYSEDVKEVLKMSNSKRNDFVLVSWSGLDSILWIAKRLEDIIHVAFHHFYLATEDGVLFKTFGEVVCSYEAFKKDGQVVLTLLGHRDVLPFMENDQKKHIWWDITTSPSMAADARTKCIEEFQLASPEPATQDKWTAYYTQRKKAIKNFDKFLNSYAGDELPFMFEHIEEGISTALAGATFDEEEDMIIHDCVVPLKVKGADDGWGNVSDVSVITRIYSPVRTTAIDVFLEYHYRTRNSCVDFYCNAYYKPYPELNTKLSVREPGIRDEQGFKELFTLCFADMPPGKRWRAKNKRSFGPTKAQLTALHKLLFGDHEMGRKMDRFAFANLLLGSVGFNLVVARNEDETDDQETVANLNWEGTESSARWLGSRIRAASGARALERDEEDTDDEQDVDEWEDDDEDSDDDADFANRFAGGPPGCPVQ